MIGLVMEVCSFQLGSLISPWLTTLGLDDQYFLRREVALTKKHPEKGDEIYIRWKSYGDVESFKQDLLSKGENPPVKIDYGAVYNVSVCYCCLYNCAWIKHDAVPGNIASTEGNSIGI